VGAREEEEDSVVPTDDIERMMAELSLKETKETPFFGGFHS